MHQTRKATVVLLFASTLWGLSWIPLKALSAKGIEGLVLIFLAYSCMAVLLLPWLWPNRRFFLSHRRALFGIFCAGGLANICFNYALIYGEVVRVMVLFYLLPVWGVLGGCFILREPTNAWRWTGVVLAVTGAFVLLGGFSIFVQPPGWLDLVALLAGLFFAVTIMLFRAVQGVPLSVKLNSLFLGCATISGGMVLLGAASAQSLPSAEAILWAAAYGVTWLLLANVGSQWAVTQIPAGRSSILMIMELVAAVSSALWLGGEMLTPNVAIGGLLIVSATAIEIRQG